MSDPLAHLLAEGERLEKLSLYGDRLRLRDVAAVAGISKGKVRDDVKRGYLLVVKVKCGTRWRFEVPQAAARQYLAELFHAA